jgi:hypothetical protein
VDYELAFDLQMEDCERLLAFFFYFTFFFLHFRRAISSSSIDGVCAMLNHACTILEEDFREVNIEIILLLFVPRKHVCDYRFNRESVAEGQKTEWLPWTDGGQK